MLIVRGPLPLARQRSTLVTDLQAVRTGDIGGGPAPVVRGAVVVAPILRAVDQAGNTAVAGAAVRALFDDANEIPCDVPTPFEVARSVICPAEAGVQQPPVRHG